jgi:hypothetical protein
MVYEISYTKKWDLADPRLGSAEISSLNNHKAPSSEEVDILVERISEGNFGLESIQVEE